MASQVLTSMVDDLDGSEATETVKFGLDGTAYEIDLSATNVDAFYAAVGPYKNAARTVVVKRGRKAK